MSDYNNRDIRDEPASMPNPAPEQRPKVRPPANPRRVSPEQRAQYQPTQPHDVQQQDYQSPPQPQRRPQPAQPEHHPQKDPEQTAREQREQRLALLRRAKQIIYFIAHTFAIIILFRFVLLALGANPTNQFANFIYSLSFPLVDPFLTLFGTVPQYGSRVFEVPDLIAVSVYYLLAWGAGKIIMLVFAPPDASGRAYE